MGSYMSGALLAGLIIGAIPAITGGIKGRLGLGLGGLAACVVGSLLLGMILSIPLCAVFMYFIFKKNDAVDWRYSTLDQQQDTISVEKPNTENIDIAEQIKKLAELRDSGILTEEEFQQKKTVLLSKL